jgi:putative FmdB family regulatory protein
MPTYAYRCGAGHQFEVKQSILEAPLVDCLTCRQPVRRMVFPVGIVFKGQGFYKTDSRSSSASSITTPAPGATAEKTTKPEAKPKDGHTSSESSKAVTAPGVATPSSSASSAGEKNG